MKTENLPKMSQEKKAMIFLVSAMFLTTFNFFYTAGSKIQEEVRQTQKLKEEKRVFDAKFISAEEYNAQKLAAQTAHNTDNAFNNSEEAKHTVSQKVYTPQEMDIHWRQITREIQSDMHQQHALMGGM